MSQKIVRAALEAVVNSFATAQSLQVAWENVAFTAPEGAYLRAFLVARPTGSLTLARTDRRYGGFMQIDLVMPLNVGAGPAETLLDALVTAFNPATVLTNSGVRVNILQPASAAAAIQEPNRYVVPVTIEYEATVY